MNASPASPAFNPANEITPSAGFRYQSRQMVVDVAEEDRQLALCRIDPALYRGALDPSAFISLAIAEGVRNGISSNGGVNMVQTLVQAQPVLRDETLTVSGEILDVQPSPRGRVTTSDTRYHRPDGSLGIRSRRTSLKTDPTVYADPAQRGAGARPAPVIADVSTLKSQGHFTLTPEDVKAYGLKTTNPIHFDEDAARRAGYRAPIIGGGHGVRFLMAALWKQYAPWAIEVDIYFRRPLFWEDGFDILVDDSADIWPAMCLAREGKVTTEMKIRSLRLRAS